MGETTSASRQQIFDQLRKAGFDWPVLEIQRLEAEVERWKDHHEDRKDVAEAYKAAARSYADLYRRLLSRINALPDEWEEDATIPPDDEYDSVYAMGKQECAVELRTIIQEHEKGGDDETD